MLNVDQLAVLGTHLQANPDHWQRGLSTMNIEDCKQRVKQKFPFPECIDNTLCRSENDIANTINKYLNPGSKILDFGSGSCEKTAIIQCLGYECTAFDDLLDGWHRENGNVKKIINFANEFNIDFKLAEDGYLPFRKEYFDMVMSHHVLEHFHDSPKDVLNDLCELLKPNGLLFITVPNAANIRKRIDLLRGRTNLPDYEGYYWLPSPWRGHVREYVKKDLCLLARYLGFKILELHGCHHMLGRVPSEIQPIYLILTKIFRGLRDSWMLVARKPGELDTSANAFKREHEQDYEKGRSVLEKLGHGCVPEKS